jgi:hypothetical protein
MDTEGSLLFSQESATGHPVWLSSKCKQNLKFCFHIAYLEIMFFSDSIIHRRENLKSHKIFPTFMDSEGSVLFSQESATGHPV